MIVPMVRVLQIVAVLIIALAVAVTFVSPLTDLLPAPQLKYAPTADLFCFVLLLSIILTVQTLLESWVFAKVRISESSDRLDLLCLRRC